MPLEKFFADELFKIILCILSVVVIFIVLIFGVNCSIRFVRTNCSTSQLHQVIAQVEMCKKTNVICSSEQKDKIIKEVCR